MDAFGADDLRGAAEIIPGRLYFHCLQQPMTLTTAPPNSICVHLDADLIYEPFCADFGPCNLAHTWRFCQRVNELLTRAQGRRVYLLVGSHPHKRSNAAALMGIYCVLHLGMTPAQAYTPLRPLEPFVGFRDASCGVPTYQLPVAQVIAGMYRAKQVGFINWHKGEHFDVEEYEHYEQVENGDLNWIVPGKFMAFSGPSAQPKHFGGWRTYMPEDYIDYFRQHNIKAVVRLNKKMYEASRFTEYGVKHHELYFPDGTCPSEQILLRFLELAERETGALAVHCKAGLGRTGVLICSYMIKHFGFSAEEAMGYIRVCRPGSVIGPQQHYLVHYGPALHQLGEEMRAAKGPAASAGAPGIELRADATAAAQAAPAPRPPAASPHRVAAPQQQVPMRRSPRTSAAQAAAQMARLDVHDEPDYMVSVPSGPSPAPASPNKPAQARGAPVHIHVAAPEVPRAASIKYSAARPPLPASAAASRASTPSKPSAGSLAPSLSLASSLASSLAVTPPAMSPAGQRAPPSSSKRMLAPNGQPRKIPMAMDFNDVAPQDLEDRDAADADSWTLNSRPQLERYTGGSRVGAFAAAAGRGASAFVEAFRSVVGNHRTTYNTRHGGGAH
ncbi:dual specificity phosphatase CDC14A isoform X2 [Micractinium conductrix]|uniref:protein-tyrosine-phosphatase n=1 Tax=Micractinium conductrix TaxID=554055 RepID=A0A2P6VHU5_9CHLO|nr:dual specificity phosphatase CDC14A isoform X2 [Micractinium conductrix]|eukprot:PSC73661.1 dual specificity phosphatase CDC14A isoform X2 [Micractinium conductrix]